jgi:GH35 family endo-1,4-beta-xylanase
LLTTGRQAAFDGPRFDVTNVMFNGSRYRVSLWVKLAPGTPDAQLRVSLQRNAGTITSFHTVIGNTLVTANNWVNLKMVYDVALANTSLTLYVESNSGTPSFYIDDFTITFVPPPVAERDIPSVFQTLSEFFPVGAAIWQGDLTGEHAVLLTKHFNQVTSENDMKWSSLQPQPGTFNFANADAQVNFAKANNMRTRGHTLVWHSQVPAWVFNDPNGNPMTPTPENKALLLQRMETHIRTVMDRYKNDIYAWDVVNEVIDPSQPDGFRRSPWFNITGTEFIDRAFQVAREVDPDCKLIINDFDTTNTAKRQFLLNLVRDLKNRGIPIDGVGHQMHNNVDFPSAQAIIDTINMFSSLGVENEITEMDCSIYSGSNPPIFDDYALIPQNLFIKQGYRYQIFFDAFRQLKGKIGSVTFWGQADDHTWLTSSARVNGPLLFDTSLKKKPAYFGVIDPSQLPCAVGCSSDITQAADPGQCGAVANYTTPMADTVCGAVTCNPPSGSFFQKGVTTVTCATPVLSRCSFTVTVTDTEKPKITCPTDITRVIEPSCPVGMSLPITYATPVATDNCSGVTVTCNPPSGSSFPVGVTAVNCAATDTSGNTASCSFNVSVFNVCLVDDNNPGVRMLINTVTGEYRFFCGGSVFSGRGVVIRSGCAFVLLDNAGGHLLTAAVDTSLKKGAAALLIQDSRQPCLITDRDLSNNNCNGG